MKVLFVHPDLGVGGAERLIVDAALAVKENGHEVSILTNHYDPNHCFEDTKSINVIKKFSSMPRHIGGRFHAFLAYLKIFLASFWIIYFSKLKFDAIVCDQISLPVAIFKWKNYKVVFYCHFPDQLLCVYDKHNNLMKRMYRAFIDWLESLTTGMADVVLVNSRFTKKIFYQTFTSLYDKKVEVLYPSLNTTVFDSLLNTFSDDNNAEKSISEIEKENQKQFEKSKKKKYIFLSINRYERKKDLKLAINAFSILKKQLKSNFNCHLIMAGGYDLRVSENVDHFLELNSLLKTLDLEDDVSLMRSISDKQKIMLLKNSFCLLYTPTNEHFGIVPIEAMYCEKPVIGKIYINFNYSSKYLYDKLKFF
jgi:alpha-1,3/alpha-1,6-mannosyltransferase